jgi:hypothetical protein
LENITPLPILTAYSFEILGTNLMMGSILWYYLKIVKGFFMGYNEEKK